MAETTRPPTAPRRPHRLEAHGDVRTDDWYWLADRSDPEVLAYLEAENAWADQVLAPSADLQERLFEEIRTRVVETDASAPSRHGDWWYWSRTEEGRQYHSFSRRHDPERLLDAVTVLAEARSGLGDEQVILDENLLAAGSDYFALGIFDLSPDQTVLAYGTDLDGSEKYRLRFRDLGTGEDLPDEVDDVTYGSAWAATGPGGRTFFYVRPDEAMRPWQVWRHVLGTPAEADQLVFEEPDERFFVSVGLTRSERWVLVQAGSKMTSEIQAVPADDPGRDPEVVLPRRQGVEYDVDHAVWDGVDDTWLVRTNAPAPDGTPTTDFALHRLAPGGGWDDLVPVLPHRPGVRLEGVDVFAHHLVVAERANGLERLRVLRPATPDAASPDAATSDASTSDLTASDAGPGWVIDQPDPVYSLTGGGNAEWDAVTYRFGYTSMVTPVSSVDVDLTDGTRQLVRTQPVRGYRAEDYRTERVWATASDGTRIPISLVAPADQPLDGSRPCVLYGYGSYEITIDPTFSPVRVNLLERGFTYAIAHIRGGGEMGRSWYEQGRLEAKATTFTDFVACAEHLVDLGWTSADRLAIRGGSAGGLLMGAVTNMRPDLWRAVVAEVPFVDVVTTMSDTSLPLTVTEWEEWGNPVDDAEAYRVMLSYSPYDNVTAGDYPAMYVTGGLNDPRVGYWEPAKWVAKMRTVRTDDRTLVLRTEMGAGHQGLSGRYDAWRDEARVQAFIIGEVGQGDLAYAPAP